MKIFSRMFHLKKNLQTWKFYAFSREFFLNLKYHGGVASGVSSLF